MENRLDETSRPIYQPCSQLLLLKACPTSALLGGSSTWAAAWIPYFTRSFQNPHESNGVKSIQLSYHKSLLKSRKKNHHRITIHRYKSISGFCQRLGQVLNDTFGLSHDTQSHLLQGICQDFSGHFQWDFNGISMGSSKRQTGELSFFANLRSEFGIDVPMLNSSPD